MIMIILTLLSSLALAGVAAWFSVVGITSIFSGAYIASLIMGASIEAGKLVGISWLYRNWKDGPWIKWPLASMTFVAMIITSIGIFGFLSKAHLEQGMPVETNKSQILVLDQKISRENEKILRYTSDIANYKVVLDQMDSQVQKLIENNKISDPKKGAKVVRESQKAEREELSANITKDQNLIDASQDQIAKLKEEQVVLQQAVTNFNVELGPIKYIAAMMYDNPDEHVDAAVRILILVIIFTFDPLAVFLLMAANHSLMKRSETPNIIVVDEYKIPEDQLIDGDEEPLDDEVLEDDPVEEEIVEEPTEQEIPVELEEPAFDEPTIEELPVDEPFIEELQVKQLKEKKEKPAIHQFGIPTASHRRDLPPNPKITELLSHYQFLKNKQEVGVSLSDLEEREMKEILPILQRHGYNIYI